MLIFYYDYYWARHELHQIPKCKAGEKNNIVVKTC